MGYYTAQDSCPSVTCQQLHRDTNTERGVDSGTERSIRELKNPTSAHTVHTSSTGQGGLQTRRTLHCEQQA